MPATDAKILAKLKRTVDQLYASEPILLQDVNASFTAGGFYALQGSTLLTAARTYTFNLKVGDFIRVNINDANTDTFVVQLSINGTVVTVAADESGFVEGVIDTAGALQVFSGASAITFNQLFYIQQKSDFPAPSAGVIQLDDGVTYVINGAVDIGTDTLRTGSGTIIIGLSSPLKDRIVYTGTGVAVQAINATALQISEIGITALSGTALDLTGIPTILILQSVQIIATNIGAVSGNRIFITSMIAIDFDGGMLVTSGGISFEAIEIHLTQSLTSTSPVIDFGATLWTGQIAITGQMTSTPGQPAISAVANNGNLSGNGLGRVTMLKLGDGVMLAGGITVDDSRWLFTIIGDQRSVFLGRIGMSGNAVVTAAPTTFTLVAGTTIADVEKRFTQVASNRVRFDVITPIQVRVDILINAIKVGGSSVHFEFAIFKTPDGGSASQVGQAVGVNVDNKGQSISFPVIDDGGTPLDVYELRVLNTENSENITVVDETMTFSVL